MDETTETIGVFQAFFQTFRLSCKGNSPSVIKLFALFARSGDADVTSPTIFLKVAFVFEWCKAVGPIKTGGT